jgi:hypothetical protein
MHARARTWTRQYGAPLPSLTPNSNAAAARRLGGRPLAEAKNGRAGRILSSLASAFR